MSLSPAELRAGDVLLLRSPGAAAWVARLFDGAEVDRAALYLGEGRVAEAAGDSVALGSLDQCTAAQVACADGAGAGPRRGASPGTRRGGSRSAARPALRLAQAARDSGAA